MARRVILRSGATKDRFPSRQFNCLGAKAILRFAQDDARGFAQDDAGLRPSDSPPYVDPHRADGARQSRRDRQDEQHRT